MASLKESAKKCAKEAKAKLLEAADIAAKMRPIPFYDPKLEPEMYKGLPLRTFRYQKSDMIPPIFLYSLSYENW